jgi:hypothetical protein
MWSVALQTLAGTIIPPVAVIGLVFVVFMPLLKSGRGRTALSMAVFGVVAVLGNAPIIIDELSHPDSAPAFILTLISVTAVAVATLSGVALFRRTSDRLVRPIAVAAIGVVVTGTVASLAMASADESPAALAGDVQVTAQSVTWAPDTIVVAATDSGLFVENLDGVRHTLTIPELGIDLEIPANSARRIDIDAATGTYQIICTVPGHEAMTATLQIES